MRAVPSLCKASRAAATCAQQLASRPATRTCSSSLTLSTSSTSLGMAPISKSAVLAPSSSCTTRSSEEAASSSTASLAEKARVFSSRISCERPPRWRSLRADSEWSSRLLSSPSAAASTSSPALAAWARSFCVPVISERVSRASTCASKPLSARSSRHASELAQQFISTPVTDAATLRSVWSISACSFGSAPSCRTLSANEESRHKLKSALPVPVRTLASSDASSSISGRIPSRAATCVRACSVDGSMASGSSASYLRGESGELGAAGWRHGGSRHAQGRLLTRGRALAPRPGSLRFASCPPCCSRASFTRKRRLRKLGSPLLSSPKLSGGVLCDYVCCWGGKILV